jgi:hypothetical protein
VIGSAGGGGRLINVGVVILRLGIDIAQPCCRISGRGFCLALDSIAKKLEVPAVRKESRTGLNLVVLCFVANVCCCAS